jgi:Phage integrase family
MTDVKIRHYAVKRGKGFWQPTPKMKSVGFGPVPCGPDGPGAWALAEEFNRRWDQTRTGAAPSPAMASAQNLSFANSEELTIYPPRSLGEAFRQYRRTEEWRRKAPATRDDWWRGWKQIKPVFGDCDPRTVRLDDLSSWRQMVEEKVSLREAHRAMKIWRALWKDAAALKYCGRDDDPSLAVRNSSPKGRSATWAEGEVARLAKRAWRMKYYGLAAVIGIAWDTQMSPGDVRALRASQMATKGEGQLFFTERSKTGVPVGGLLSARTIRLLAAYLDQLGVTLTGEAYIFRNRSGAPYSKDTLGDDFRDIRAAEFGSLERRMLGHDFRRSGAVEAITGDATPAAVAHAMGNTLSASNSLFATYVPVNATTIKSVFEARKKGRKAMR